MRVPPVERRRRGGFRIRGWMIAILVVLVVLFLSARGLAGFYTDYLWFDSVGFGADLAGPALGPVRAVGGLHGPLLRADAREPHAWPTASPPGPARWGPRTSCSPATSSPSVRTAVASGSRSRRSSRCVAGGSVTGQWQQWILFTHAQVLRGRRPAVPQGRRLLRVPAAVPDVPVRLAVRRRSSSS